MHKSKIFVVDESDRVDKWKCLTRKNLNLANSSAVFVGQDLFIFPWGQGSAYLRYENIVNPRKMKLTDHWIDQEDILETLKPAMFSVCAT